MTEGEELWRQVAIRMWARLMGSRRRPPLLGSPPGCGYEATGVGLGVPGMGFRDAVRSMVRALNVCGWWGASMTFYFGPSDVGM